MGGDPDKRIRRAECKECGQRIPTFRDFGTFDHLERFGLHARHGGERCAGSGGATAKGSAASVGGDPDG